MSGLTSYRMPLRESLTSGPWSRVAVRAVVVAAALVGMVGVGWTGAEPNMFLSLVVAALAAYSSTRPDSPFGALVVGMIGLHWFFVTDATALGWSVVPALCLFLVHAGLAALSVSAPQSALPGPFLVRWAMHAGAVGVATVVVWALALSLGGLDWPGHVLLTALGFVALVAVAVVLGQRADGQGSSLDRTQGPIGEGGMIGPEMSDAHALMKHRARN